MNYSIIMISLLISLSFLNGVNGTDAKSVNEAIERGRIAAAKRSEEKRRQEEEEKEKREKQRQDEENKRKEERLANEIERQQKIAFIESLNPQKHAQEGFNDIYRQINENENVQNRIINALSEGNETSECITVFSKAFRWPIAMDDMMVRYIDLPDGFPNYVKDDKNEKHKALELVDKELYKNHKEYQRRLTEGPFSDDWVLEVRKNSLLLYNIRIDLCRRPKSKLARYLGL